MFSYFCESILPTLLRGPAIMDDIEFGMIVDQMIYENGLTITALNLVIFTVFKPIFLFSCIYLAYFLVAIYDKYHAKGA